MAVNRSLVIQEAYPAAANDITHLAEESGGWMCERHPHQQWPHDDCPGPGELRSPINPANPDKNSRDSNP